MVLSSLVPLTTTNSAPNPPGQVSDAQNVINFLHCVKDAFQSPISSPSITTQEYPRPLANENLVRAPIKSQRQQQQSSGRDHVTGAPPKSNPHQSSSLMGRTEMSFAPSMDCTLPLVQNKAPSVRTSPPNKRNSIGSYHSDIKRLPQGLSRTPGSLLADAYSPSGFCNSSPTKPNTSPSQQSSCDVAGGNHDVAGGRRRGNGCQRNLLDKKQVESVVVIDEEEGERLKDNSRHQTKPSKGSRDSQKAPSDVSELHVVSCGNGTLFESQAGSGEHRGNTSLSIPPYHDLKEQSPRSKMKLKKTQEAKRPGYKEKVDSNAVFISSAPAAPPVYVDAGEPTDSTGMSCDRVHHTHF